MGGRGPFLVLVLVVVLVLESDCRHGIQYLLGMRIRRYSIPPRAEQIEDEDDDEYEDDLIASYPIKGLSMTAKE